MFQRWKSLLENLWSCLRGARRKAITGSDLVRALDRKGWRLLRVCGGHRIYGKQGVSALLPILVHGNPILKVGVLTHLLKSAGLTEKDI
jgi:predicted RNA binding protein YcfA (HicA-like mRNA interferase family)